MRAAVFLPMAVGYVTFLVLRLNSLRRDPRNPFLRSICVVLVFAAAGACAGIPTVATALETASGVVAMWILVPVTAGCAAAWSMFVLWAQPLPEATRKLRVGLPAYALAITAIIVLTVAARGSITDEDIIRHEQAPEPLWAATPYVRDAYLVYAAALGFTWADATLRTLIFVRLVDRRWLRRAIWTLFHGHLLFLLYTASSAGYFVSVRVGSEIPLLREVGLIAAAVAGIFSATGVALPTLGPRWDRMLWYRRLKPLWAAIYQAVPHVALERPRATTFADWSPWRSDFRVYRRVIEIRDGILALRPYFDPEVGALATRLGQATHQAGPQLDATVMAAQLVAAIRDKQHGLPPHRRDIAENPPPTGGHDLDSELSLLLPLADAFATSRIVTTAAAARQPSARASRPTK